MEPGAFLPSGLCRARRYLWGFMAANDKDPLAELISSDARATDRKKLSELLKPYVAIDGDSKEFSFLPAFDDITDNDRKIELILAAAKARALYFQLEDGLVPKEIIDLGTMPAGSVKTSLRRLNGGHKVKKDKAGRYFLPPYRVPELLKKPNEVKG
jgi:hypothetical protein